MLVTPVNKKFGKYSPGDSFEFPDRAAKIMIKVGKLAAYETRALDAEPQVEISERTGQPKRQYRRRDMTPEG